MDDSEDTEESTTETYVERVFERFESSHTRVFKRKCVEEGTMPPALATSPAGGQPLLSSLMLSAFLIRAAVELRTDNRSLCVPKEESNRNKGKKGSENI